MKKAILFGASGFIGSTLLEEILKSSDYDQVIAVTRKKLNRDHPKLKTLIADFDSLQNIKSQIQGDDIFITLGTTKKKTPDHDEYYKIDHDYPLLAAKLAKENGATSVFVVTSVGAHANSPFFYIRTKGQLEKDILDLNFDFTHFFRPSMLLGHRKEFRPMEYFWKYLWVIINPLLIGQASRYRGISGQTVAQAMLQFASCPAHKINTYHWQEMQNIQISPNQSYWPFKIFSKLT